MRKLRERTILVLILLVLVLMGGCSRKGSRNQTQGNLQVNGQSRSESGAPASSHEETRPGPGAIRLSAVRPTTGSVSARKSSLVGSGVIGLTGTDRLLAVRGGGAVFPSDFEIGPLQPPVPVGTQRGEILRVVREFFGGLSRGKLDTALMSPEWKDDLIRRLSYPRSRGDLPTAVRIGTLWVNGRTAHAAIRMERGAGRAAGEIYLDRSDGIWYVSDIQADFSRLATPFVRNKPFDPVEWKSLMKE